MAAASGILAMLPASSMIDNASVAPGGFINIRLRPAFINQGIAKIIKVWRGDTACGFQCFAGTVIDPCLVLCRA